MTRRQLLLALALPAEPELIRVTKEEKDRLQAEWVRKVNERKAGLGEGPLAGPHEGTITAYFQPAPAWTRTPPSEPGRYQIRYVGKFSDLHQHLAGVHIVEVAMREPRTLASGRVAPAVAMVYPLQAPGGEACAWELAESERLGVEWWPVPIQPPEDA